MFWLLWEPLLQGSAQARLAPRTTGNASSRYRETEETSLNTAANAFAWLDPFGDQVCCILSENAECKSLSPNWESLTGFTDGECLGGLFLQRLHPDFHQKLKERLKDASDSLPKLRCQFLHADKTWHWYDISLSPITGIPDDKSYLCVMRNISQDVKEQHHLQKAKLEAELALKGRSEFLANMSHELRTPLNAIMGFSEIMKSQMFGRIGSKRYLDYLGNIHESGGQLLSRISDLIEIANLEAGLISLREEEFSLEDAIKAAVEIHSHRAFSEKVQIHVDMPDGSVKLYADRVKMTQALSNLISNAVKFSKKNGKVTVRATRDAEGGLSLVVADNGRGIGVKHLAIIRGILSEENSLYALGRENLGLGLVIAKELLKLHQGHLSIDSKSGSGTKVTFFLPAERVIPVRTKATARTRRKIAQSA